MERVKIDKNMKFDISLFPSEMTQTHPQFTRAKIRIFYEGVNRNNSHFTKEVINNAQFSAYNIPIVGESINGENFGGHGGKVEIDGEEIKFVQTTVPYGVVPMDAQFSWEPVIEKNGEIREYFTIDGALLWTGRYPELDTILEEGVYGQSAEIVVNSGNFAIVDGQETFKIDDYIYSALCILGIDKDGNSPNDHTEPCFESASISTYGLEEDNFKQNFNQMLATYASNNKELNNQVESKKDFNEESGGSKLSKQLVFELTHQQLSAKLRQDLEVHRFIDKDGESARRYWYQDHTNTKVIYEDLAEAGQLYESPYTVNGNDVTIDLSDKVEASLAFIPNSRSGNGEGRRGRDYNLETELEKAEAKLAEFEAQLTAKEEATEETVESLKTKHAEEFTALKAEYSETVAGMKTDLEALSSKSADFEAVMTEVESLREFKRNAEVDAVRAKFSGKLTDESLETILSANFEASTDELEAMIFAEIGKQNFSLVEESKAPTSVQFSQRKESKDDGYNGLFTQFSAK